jgi:RNA polymerase sigma-70 factor (ECF subfamily)
MRYVKDEIEADDVTQEAMLLAHRHRDSFAGRSRYSTWLYRVAATTALMYLRKKKRLSRECSNERAYGAETDPTATPEERAAARQELDAISRALARLAPKYRDVFLLRFRDGKTDAEVAETLGLTLTAAKTRAYRARSKIRERLAA